MKTQGTSQDWSEIRNILKELSASQKETDRRMKETDRQMQETDQRMKETDRQIKLSFKRVKKAEDLFTNQWGRLVESLVRGRLLELFQDKGIDVETIASNVEVFEKRVGSDNVTRKEKFGEIDVLVKNGGEVIIVEVKTSLSVDKVNDFLDFVSKLSGLLSECKGKKVYGAVAYLHIKEGADVYAEKKGLFVIRATGDSASLVNREGFQPRNFA